MSGEFSINSDTIQVQQNNGKFNPDAYKNVLADMSDEALKKGINGNENWGCGDETQFQSKTFEELVEKTLSKHRHEFSNLSAKEIEKELIEILMEENPELTKSEIKRELRELRRLEQPEQSELPNLQALRATEETIIKEEMTKDISDSPLKTDDSSAEKITEEQALAREKLDAKISSAGVSYKDAKAEMERISEKYQNNKNYQSEFIKTDNGFSIKWQLDPEKLPEPDKSAYFDAVANMQEIEHNNSALFHRTGLEKTIIPKKPELQF